MNEDFLYELAVKFAPTYTASLGEKCFLVELEPEEEPRTSKAYPAWNPFVYFSAVQLNPHEDRTAYEINYLTIWDRDTGGILGSWSAHQWDTERTAILVEGPKDEEDAEAFSAKEAYYAAHEGMPFVDKSEFCSCPSGDCGITFCWSEGKHASYPGDPRTFFAFELFESPGYESAPDAYRLVDVGTLENPKVPWICYDHPWGPDDVGSVCKKLKSRLWDPQTWEQIERARYTKEQILHYQEVQDLPVTGKVDVDTIRAVYQRGTENVSL
jgi:hypothetical protein